MNLEQQLKQTLELPEAMPEEAGAYDRFLRHRRRRTRAVGRRRWPDAHPAAHRGRHGAQAPGW